MRTDGFAAWKVKPVSGSLLNMTNEGLEQIARYQIHSTKEIISLTGSGALPEKLVINTHPQRWNDALIPWIIELYLQLIKNQLKRFIIKYPGMEDNKLKFSFIRYYIISSYVIEFYYSDQIWMQSSARIKSLADGFIYFQTE